MTDEDFEFSRAISQLQYLAKAGGLISRDNSDNQSCLDAIDGIVAIFDAIEEKAGSLYARLDSVAIAAKGSSAP